MRLTSVLRCPTCGHEAELAMPTDACLFFHECAACHALLRPRPGDCCVFCSYGSVPCPPMQEGSSCCRDACGPQGSARDAVADSTDAGSTVTAP
jgi:hypothetical protein